MILNAPFSINSYLCRKLKAMKKLLYFIAVVLLSVSSLRAQDTKGTDFWLTFGNNRGNSYTVVDLQMRIVNGGMNNTVSIVFTESGATDTYPLAPQEIKTIELLSGQKQAVYNVTQGESSKSIHITTEHPVTVYALNQANVTTDASNILPVTALGTEYYHISYFPQSGLLDAYAVIATENNTKIFHNGSEVAMLDVGKVYYHTAPLSTDMTGAHITANYPIAFFALCQGVYIPVGYTFSDHLFQQLAPVKTWGKEFFVPTSNLGKDIVRIVASENDTNIDQLGGTMLYPTGGQTGYTINAGEFIELEISLANNGCYIEADKPIGVCTYLTSSGYNPSGGSDPSQGWLPAIEQSITNALIAPFIPNGDTRIDSHYAIVMTPTGTETNTEVSIGGGAPGSVSGGIWRSNSDAIMSFYIMPLDDPDASYYFTNDAGIIVMCYGIGPNESYYYLAGSSMRNLSAAFSANDVPYTEMADTLFCVNEITFTTNILNTAEVDSMKWYKQKLSGNTPDLDYILITDIVEDPPVEWTRTFRAGNYMIKLEVYHNGEPEPLVYEGELCVGAHITIYPTPNDGGMTKPTTGCYKVGTQLPMEAYPY